LGNFSSRAEVFVFVTGESQFNPFIGIWSYRKLRNGQKEENFCTCTENGSPYENSVIAKKNFTKSHKRKKKN